MSETRAPARKCGDCDYYDGGGLRPDGTWVMLHGDCQHSRSPRFTTTVDQTCSVFFPDTTRWPRLPLKHKVA